MFQTTTFAPGQLSEGIPGKEVKEYTIAFKTATGFLSPFIYWKFKDEEERDQVYELLCSRYCRQICLNENQ